ncbi:Fe2+/Zn2+ regulated transporter [Klebsormidium nitens]|uniref:Fe2+/Zn2+ regulated transporter n=1 Tax=Klebsormidium nitens TaxID=105231 RepID=A0A1Y1I9Y8_KLENI|nr:Fe2+/Zn2+ regulated transporter [Klebsormidium nitens]|eukprot:GAQ87784.1 Fe2+/Zn2+ regulated transporter [Klebsormidium nitens]
MARACIRSVTVALLVALAVSFPLLASAHNGVIHDTPDEPEETPAAATTAAGTTAATTGSATAASPEAVIDLRSSHLIGNKVGCLAVIFAVPFIGCLLPFFVRFSYDVIVYGTLFGSGLFVTLALMHLVPDSAAGFNYLSDSHYPWAYLLVVAGYFFAFLADLIVHAVWERKEQHDRQAAELKAAQLGAGSAPAASAPSGGKLCCQARPSKQTVDEETALAGAAASYCCDGNCKCQGDLCQCPQERGGHAKPGVGEFDQQYLKAAEAVESKLAHNVHGLSLADIAILVLALCFHAIFEGLAIGLSATSKDAWKTTSSIVIHKIFEGLALGASLLMHNPKRSFLSLLPFGVGFAIAAPVGLAIGIILDSTAEPRTALWVDTIGNGIAAGVFLFVGIGHLMAKAFKASCTDTWRTPFFKWTAAALGVTTMALIQMDHD